MSIQLAVLKPGTLSNEKSVAVPCLGQDRCDGTKNFVYLRILIVSRQDYQDEYNSVWQI